MNPEPENEKKEKRPPRYLGAGLVLGVGMGAALGNIAVGIAVGLAIGAALSSYHKEKQQNENDADDEGSHDDGEVKE